MRKNLIRVTLRKVGVKVLLDYFVRLNLFIAIVIAM